MNTILTSYELPLQLIASSNTFIGNIGFAIANYVREYPMYKDYYKAMLHNRIPVILDNGLHETGDSLPLDDLIEAIALLGDNPNLYVIAPDKLHDAHWTYSSTLKCIDALKGCHCRIAGVAQGRNTHEANYLYQELITIGCNMLCLPFKADRPSFLRNFPLRYDIPHHLLGCYGLDEIAFIRCHIPLPRYTSIDTAKPIKAGIALTHIKDYTRHKGLWNIEESLTQAQLDQININLTAFSYACKGPIDALPPSSYTYQRP